MMTQNEIKELASECLDIIESNFDENHKWHIGYKIKKELKNESLSPEFVDFLTVIHSYLKDPTNQEKLTAMQIKVYGDSRTTFVYKDFEGNYVCYLGYDKEENEHVFVKEKDHWSRGASTEEAAKKYVNQVNKQIGYKAIQYVEEVTCAIR